MDLASKNVISFLETLQVSRDSLTATLWNALTLRGAQPESPFIILSARQNMSNSEHYSGSVSLGIRAKRPLGKPMDFTIEILWGRDKWVVRTEVWTDSDNNQDLVHEFPERFAIDLDQCLAHIEAAVSDLSTCVRFV